MAKVLVHADTSKMITVVIFILMVSVGAIKNKDRGQRNIKV